MAQDALTPLWRAGAPGQGALGALSSPGQPEQGTVLVPHQHKLFSGRKVHFPHFTDSSPRPIPVKATQGGSAHPARPQPCPWARGTLWGCDRDWPSSHQVTPQGTFPPLVGSWEHTTVFTPEHNSDQSNSLSPPVFKEF